ncbi:DUF4372 domain-containing protein [Brevibacillus gelatini]|uniref:DUF4372 domain-containing protein n=1 Tax=Brevibacillus gelatini TaxID=1655277 RepID=UPI003D814F74
MDKNTLFSSFGKWVSPIFSKRFFEDLASSDHDKYVKKLTTSAYLLLFLHAHLQQREGLRAIADDALGRKFQQELGFTSISPSQLVNVNQNVDHRAHQKIDHHGKNQSTRRVGNFFMITIFECSA